MKKLYGKENDNYKNLKCIYKIINNKTGKVYIGSTVNFKNRINGHINDLTYNMHINKELQNDWNIYQPDSFSFEILEEVNDQAELQAKEIYYIDEFRKINDVYNKSNPINERIKGRNIKTVKDRIDLNNIVKKEYALSKRVILEWLDGEFNKMINKMLSQINHRLYFEKDKVDKWFLDNIHSDEILNDSRIVDILHKWYNNHGFVVVSSNLYIKEFEDIFNIKLEVNKNLLITKNTHKTIRMQRKQDHKDYYKRYRK